MNDMTSMQLAFSVFYVLVFIITLVIVDDERKTNGYGSLKHIPAVFVTAMMWPIYYVFMMIRLWSHWRKRLKHPWLNE